MVRHRKLPCRGEGGCCQNFSRTQLRTDHQCPGPPDHPFLPPPNLTPSLLWYIGRGRQKKTVSFVTFFKKEGRGGQTKIQKCWCTLVAELQISPSQKKIYWKRATQAYFQLLRSTLCPSACFIGSTVPYPRLLINLIQKTTICLDATHIVVLALLDQEGV